MNLPRQYTSVCETARRCVDSYQFSKCLRGLVVFRCMNFLRWTKILRVLEGTRAGCLRPGAPGILPNIFF